MNERLVLCSASNETYILGAAVALCSALHHLSKRSESPLVYVLDGGIRERSWSKLQQSVERVRPDCILQRLRPDMAVFEGLPQDWGSSVMAYARLALPALVPDDRIVYIDADLLVQRDLGELWCADLGNAVIAAVTDLNVKTLGEATLPIQELGLPEGAPCFNSGFLVIDLTKWRAEDISAAALQYLQRWPQHAANWDQSALNVVLYGRWKAIDVSWNTPGWWADQGREGCTLDAPVLHFVGPHKPWLLGYDRGHSAQIFFRELDRTAWRGWRPSRLRQACKWAKYRVWQITNEVSNRLRGVRSGIMTGTGSHAKAGIDR
jgi:lipopolysaccharide biosynthesis glycosyltransferase